MIAPAFRCYRLSPASLHRIVLTNLETLMVLVKGTTNHQGSKVLHDLRAKEVENVGFKLLAYVRQDFWYAAWGNHGTPKTTALVILLASASQPA